METSLFQEHLMSAYVYASLKIHLDHNDSYYFEFMSNIFIAILCPMYICMHFEYSIHQNEISNLLPPLNNGSKNVKVHVINM